MLTLRKSYSILFILILLISTQLMAQENTFSKFEECGLSPQARELAYLIIESTDQQRSKLMCNKKLAKIALIKAKLMASTNKISHRINYITPNQLLRQHDITLPNNYPMFDNQVESIMGAVKTAQQSYDIFMTSPDHKSHLLGEKDFLLKQNQIGIGFYKDKNSDFVYHWVVYITQIIFKE
ncbi:MAG: CAP domain-containing protein [Marinicellaceae bacterium]